MTEAVLLRLFTPAECQEEQDKADVDIGLKAVLAAAASQVAEMPNINCMCCGNALEGLAAYVSIVVTHDLSGWPGSALPAVLPAHAPISGAMRRAMRR